MDSVTQEKLLILMREGRSRAESTDWFRVALGLVYLAGLMTKETIDFKAVDREFNRFIYHTLGKGHTITSVLQFMSGARVMPTVESERFLDAFKRHCPGVPLVSVPFLLELNLGVAKNISGLEPEGPLVDWIARRKLEPGEEPEGPTAQAHSGARADGI
ncbi:hypothetical protein [Telluria beijingensis]|uniref:hypothetical protein n=1 Tax=Telluria beijingensis TaxID=3068633 RepID=UPI002796358A|nr:hypothetical protein [Massilia sp. REN29]